MITHPAKEKKQHYEQWRWGVGGNRKEGGGWTKIEKRGEISNTRGLHKIWEVRTI